MRSVILFLVQSLRTVAFAQTPFAESININAVLLLDASLLCLHYLHLCIICLIQTLEALVANLLNAPFKTSSLSGMHYCVSGGKPQSSVAAGLTEGIS